MGYICEHGLTGGSTGVAGHMRLIYLDRNHVLGQIAANKTDISTVEAIVVVSAAGAGYLSRTGLTADCVLGRKIQITKTFFVEVLINQILHHAADIRADLI